MKYGALRWRAKRDGVYHAVSFTESFVLMNTDRRRLTLHQLAWMTVVLMIVVTSVSAWLRLAQPRPPCAKWPVCRSLSIQASVSSPTDPMPTVYNLDLARAVHRAVASLTLVVVAALVVIALGLRPRDWQAGAPALALLGLALGLAVLGIFTTGSRGVAVLLGNMLGGFSMLALAWRMTRPRVALDVAVARSVRRRASIAAVLWGCQAAFGAVSGTGAGIVIAIVHPILGLAVSLWVFSLAALARRSGLFGEGTALLVIAMIQWPLGICAALLGAPPLLVLLHNISAAFGIALLVGLIGRGAPSHAGIATPHLTKAS